MGQLLLPLFASDTKMINLILGVREQSGTVFYLLNGMPIYSHASEDLHKFRFITSNLILQGLCKNKEIVDAFHVSSDSVRRWKKLLDEQGEGVFFKEEARHGRPHKLLPEALARIQIELDKGRSVNGIAKEEGLSEGSLRYAITQGKLKKNANQSETAITRSERSHEDAKAAQEIGIAASRIQERA